MTYIPNSICFTCKVPMKIHKNGIAMEMYSDINTPYYKISGDAYECPSCLHTIVSGFGKPCMTFDKRYEDWQTINTKIVL